MRLLLAATAATILILPAASAGAQTYSVQVTGGPSHYGVSRGTDYWGPHGQWNRWDNRWGDAHAYASRWGFDEYSPQHGWRRQNQWYASPSQWSGWGGWNWVFEAVLSSGRDWERGRSHGYDRDDDDRYSNRGHRDDRGRNHDRHRDGGRYSYRQPHWGSNSYGYQHLPQTCYRQQSTDWINGRRAVVSYVLCRDGYGRNYEQPGTRQVERWIW